MSRIRSIHPGIWTDEAFVSLSSFARLLYIGMWNECDDKGTFQWSPLKLKMRLLPADNVDAAALLAEIEEAGMIQRYNVTGKDFGVVRNFCLYQRPKKPNDIHPASEQVLVFAGMDKEQASLKATPVPNQLPTGGEKSPQREEGGGNRNTISNDMGVPPTARDFQKTLFDSGVNILKAAGHNDRQARSMLGRWRKSYSDSQVISALAKCEVEAPSDPIGWITQTLKREATGNGKPNYHDEPQNPYVRAVLERQADRAGVGF